MTKYITWGPVRGYGRVRKTREQAEADLRRDQRGCVAQGGYSDRDVYAVDEDGWLRTDSGDHVWAPGQLSTGAERIFLDRIYRVSISDRKRDRIIRNESTPADAARAAVGSRLLTCREDSRDMDGTSWVYEAAVQTGPTRSGSTPFRSIRIYVSAE